MMNTYLNRLANYFEHGKNIGVIGRGETIEKSFTDAAFAMFALMTNPESIHLREIITFEFTEEDKELALITWLNTLLSKSKEHNLILIDFRLKREGNVWSATVSGEKWQDHMPRNMEVKAATKTSLSVEKIDHNWEAKCVLSVESKT